jgi:hypothetical protein
MAVKVFGLTKNLSWFICLMGLYKLVPHFTCYLDLPFNSDSNSL